MRLGRQGGQTCPVHYMEAGSTRQFPIAISLANNRFDVHRQGCRVMNISPWQSHFKAAGDQDGTQSSEA
ncbi:hypothetical protein P308_28955 [Pseudomonas piscis]|nr:hypothetical protein P308_28955 [Pseudomonas piscis]